MKLQQTTGENRNLFTGYGDGYLLINHQRYDGNLIVTPNEIIAWDVTLFDALTPDHFNRLSTLHPEVILFGTGKTQRFPHPSLIANLGYTGVGVEVMDTPAACRTYNILLAEDRQVIAALLGTSNCK